MKESTINSFQISELNDRLPDRLKFHLHSMNYDLILDGPTDQLLIRIDSTKTMTIAYGVVDEEYKKHSCQSWYLLKNRDLYLDYIFDPSSICTNRWLAVQSLPRMSTANQYESVAQDIRKMDELVRDTMC